MHKLWTILKVSISQNTVHKTLVTEMLTGMTECMTYWMEAARKEGRKEWVMCDDIGLEQGGPDPTYPPCHSISKIVHCSSNFSTVNMGKVPTMVQLHSRYA